MLNLDTHIVLFAVNDTLTLTEASLIAGDECGVSSGVFWEIHKLHQVGKINTSLDDPVLLALLQRLQVWPITREIGEAASLLDFKSDPIDELIAATSIVRHAPLLTRDRKMSASQIVPLAR